MATLDLKRPFTKEGCEYVRVAVIPDLSSNNTDEFIEQLNRIGLRDTIEVDGTTYSICIERSGYDVDEDECDSGDWELTR